MSIIIEKPEGFIKARIQNSGRRSILIMECEDSTETEELGESYQQFEVEITENELIVSES